MNILALALFVARIFTHNTDTTLATNRFAFCAYFFDRGFDLHK